MKHSALVLVVLALVGSAQAGMVENFESYELGLFQGQSSSWSGVGGGWAVVDYNGDKVLYIGNDVTDSAILYTPEQFSAAGEGYTVMMTMHIISAWAGEYTGFVCDAESGMQTFRRFMPSGNGTLMSSGGATINGTSPLVIAQPVYWRMYRQDDQVTIWNSLTPIDATNPGTIALQGTVNSLAGGYVGLYGCFPTLYDDVVIMEGNYIPEPATLSLLGMGGLGVLARRKRQ